jgi:hypothetical protein
VPADRAAANEMQDRRHNGRQSVQRGRPLARLYDSGDRSGRVLIEINDGI